ncbi:transposase [Leptospira sp. 201903070]|uniref:Transposase n=1 Tax=Leptospira ainlahdjerensis TaxID=2810033 RepID=A0ABS2UE83_9LEPT|nr:transposase [Leptospira ainlahdjerensis]
MYLDRVSVRRVEDITESFWGTKVSPSTIIKLNQKVFVQIDEWRIRTPYKSISLRLLGWNLLEKVLGWRSSRRSDSCSRRG